MSNNVEPIRPGVAIPNGVGRPKEIEQFKPEIVAPRKSKSGSAGRSKRQGFSGQWSGRLIEMLESTAYRALSGNALRAMSRIEIEIAHHGGNSLENGRLVVTHEQFRDYGIPPNSVAPAIRELEALGFIEVTEHGVAGNEAFRRANRFRLTYRPAGTKPGDGSHEWRRFDGMTLEQTSAIAAAAREHKRENYRLKRRESPSTGKPSTVVQSGKAE
jgi:hypothetical protein